MGSNVAVNQRPTIFLRRLKPSQLTYKKVGAGFVREVSPEAYLCREDDVNELSLHIKMKILADPVGIKYYQKNGKFHESGDLPLVSSLDFAKLVQKGILNKLPKFSRDVNDKRFGSYHYTIPCPDEAQRIALASNSRIELLEVKALYDVDLAETFEQVSARCS